MATHGYPADTGTSSTGTSATNTIFTITGAIGTAVVISNAVVGSVWTIIVTFEQLVMSPIFAWIENALPIAFGQLRLPGLDVLGEIGVAEDQRHRADSFEDRRRQRQPINLSAGVGLRLAA